MADAPLAHRAHRTREVEISYHGFPVTTLRGEAAARFVGHIEVSYMQKLQEYRCLAGKPRASRPGADAGFCRPGELAQL